MKNPSSEVIKIPKTKGISFDYFNLIIKTFSTAIRIGNIKRIAYFLSPII